MRKGNIFDPPTSCSGKTYKNVCFSTRTGGLFRYDYDVLLKEEKRNKFSCHPTSTFRTKGNNLLQKMPDSNKKTEKKVFFHIESIFNKFII